MTEPQYGLYVPGPRRRTLLLGAAAFFALGTLVGLLLSVDRPRLSSVPPRPANIALACYQTPFTARRDLPTPARYEPNVPSLICVGEKQ